MGAAPVQTSWPESGEEKMAQRESGKGKRQLITPSPQVPMTLGSILLVCEPHVRDPKAWTLYHYYTVLPPNLCLWHHQDLGVWVRASVS